MDLEIGSVLTGTDGVSHDAPGNSADMVSSHDDKTTLQITGNYAYRFSKRIDYSCLAFEKYGVITLVFLLVKLSITS
jgi:hypothetical protein